MKPRRAADIQADIDRLNLELSIGRVWLTFLGGTIIGWGLYLALAAFLYWAGL